MDVHGGGVVQRVNARSVGRRGRPPPRVLLQFYRSGGVPHLRRPAASFLTRRLFPDRPSPLMTLTSMEFVSRLSLTFDVVVTVVTRRVVVKGDSEEAQ